MIRRISSISLRTVFLRFPVNSVPVKIELVKEFADGIPKILGDYLQLKQAFYNLIKNACESMDAKGNPLPPALPFFEEWDLLCEAGGERYGERD